MEIKKIVEGMTAKEVSGVIDHNFGEIVSEKADKSYVDEKLKNIVSGSVSGYKYLTSTDELPTEQTTIGYIIGNDMYLYVGEGGNTLGGLYQNVGPFKGEKGDTGERGADGLQGEKGEKGDKGEAGVTSATIRIDDTTGIPSASVSIENQVLNISLSGLKGEQGNSGYQGAADELEIVNNITQGGAEKALSAEMGKVLLSYIKELSLVEAKLNSTLYKLYEDYTNTIKDTTQEGFSISDRDGNVALSYGKDGLDFAAISKNAINIIKNNIGQVGLKDVYEKGFYLVDNSGYVGVYVNQEGLHAINMLEF